MAAALLPFARRYVWWKTPTEAVALPKRLIAQVMNMGDHRDVEALARLVGDAVLRLGLADVGRVPPLPTRRFS